MKSDGKNEVNENEVNEYNNSKNKVNGYSDRFSRLMFGPFPPRQAITEHKKDETNFSEPPHQIDFMQLMKDIDTLVSSFEKFKPIIKQITPLFNLFKNKG
jgi:hypothetical protein